MTRSFWNVAIFILLQLSFSVKAFMPLNVASRKQASSVLSNAHKVILTTMNNQHYRSSHTNLSSSSSPLAESDLKSILSVATAAAKKAGEIIVSNAGGADVTKTKANPRDLLTMIDPLCEKAIRETVLEVFPSHDFWERRMFRLERRQVPQLWI
jgi:Archaeal fructose-1,6-bisphosphatase and related enzymes of inositol monophosphatase family